MSTRPLRAVPAPSGRSSMSEARKAASTLPTAYLICRTFQHSWSDELHAEWDALLRRWVVYLVCVRCDTRKPVPMSRDGYLTGDAPRYEHPRDYAVPRSEASLTDRDGRAAVRAELLARLELLARESSG